ncbi:MAG: thiopurine S-methyltransferase [Pseudomonadota bacterium]
MEPSFWHERWASGRTAFHQPKGNPLLAKHLAALALAPGASVFVPLSGKTGDIGWLLSQGFNVVANELSEMAIKELFDELDLTPVVQAKGALKAYRAERLTVFVGDFFDLDKEMLGPVDAVYDRAALVALPDDRLRKRYAEHLHTIAYKAPQLVITFEYADGVLEGPPFSVSPHNIAKMHGPHYMLAEVERRGASGSLSDVAAIEEVVWILTPN